MSWVRVGASFSACRRPVTVGLADATTHTCIAVTGDDARAKALRINYAGDTI